MHAFPASLRPRRVLRVALVLVTTAAGLCAMPAGALAHEELSEEPLIPGIDSVTDFEVAPDGDVYVSHQDGRLERYHRAAGSTTAHPRYSLHPDLLYQFDVTRQNDRGLVGFTLDSQWNSGHHQLYVALTRGSVPWVGDRPGGNPNGVRRTAQLVRMEVPASGPATAGDLTVILGTDAPADLDSTCKPFAQGQAPAGETDALPNGIQMVEADSNFPTGALVADFSEPHVYPDGDLGTRADGAYDCIPSDADTHGVGDVMSAPDGTLFLSVGDSMPWNVTSGASLRTYNLESPVGKILHVDRSGHGIGGHPFCQSETDLTRTCSKVWAMGFRNAFRFTPLPADSRSQGQPVLAAGNVGDFSIETLDLVRPGTNAGWPCWEGTYWRFYFADPSPSAAGVKSAWGGPAFLPPNAQSTSCMNVAPTGTGAAPSAVTMPIVEYEHDQGDGNHGAAIVAGPRVTSLAGTDPQVAMPASWEGSLFFGDYVRGWIMRLSPDASDPSNADEDGGLVVPGDELRSPNVQTNAVGTRVVDPLLDQIASAPAEGQDGPPWYRLTMRQGPDGALWTAHIGSPSKGGGLTRFRAPAAAQAQIAQVTGACATVGAQGPVTLVAADAGVGASYHWDVDGDGVFDTGYGDAGDTSGRTIQLSASELQAALAPPSNGWVRLFVNAGTDESVAARYLCQGPTPTLSITSPADHAQVVLGQPVTISASRPAGDDQATGIPNSALRWTATTVHGGSHEHPLADRTGGEESVQGQPRLQLTITPASDHELGSSTRVRLWAPTADAGGTTVVLEPKPVPVTLSSSPSGATVSLARDVGTTDSIAPATVTMAAGFSTKLSAASTLSVGAQGYAFSRWSDGVTDRVRIWSIPAAGGAAPTAQYAPVLVPTTPGGSTPPTSPLALTAPTAQDVAGAQFAVIPGRRGKASALTGTLDFGRDLIGSALTLKVALRDANCHWWSFGKRRFVGTARACAKPPAWSAAKPSWGKRTTFDLLPLARLPKGRYAVRIRVQYRSEILGERVAAAVVR